MVTIEDITALLVAIGGLTVAVATLVRAFRDVYTRIDTNDEHIAHLWDLYLGSSTKVPPEDNP